MGAGGLGSEGSHIPLLIELMRQDGVTFPDNRRLQFTSLAPLTGGVLHAEGAAPALQPARESPEQRAAISFGPQHGAVTARQVEDALYEAYRGGYDLLVFAGFAFDAAALSAIETGHPRLKVFFSHVRPDVLLTDAKGDSLLKTTASAQLFTVFGEPDVALRPRPDGAFEVELLGVDVYDPLTGEVHSARASQVAAWFLDTDYDRRTFHICQAFFPNKSAWQKLERALKGTLNEDLFDQLTGRVSLPFEPGEHRRVAVKVIDQRGNEVMRVVGMVA
jgi:adenine-specific DNA-methyltransferase